MKTKDKKEATVTLSTFLTIIILTITIMTIGFYFFFSYKMEEVNKNKKESNTDVSEGQESNQSNDDNFIFLFDGCEIEKKVGLQRSPAYIEATEDNISKYEINYYAYDKSGEMSEVKGVFEKDKAYEGYGLVNNTKKVASSLKYDVMPRKATKIDDYNEIKEFSEFNGISNVNVEAIDLDGDETLEYIVSLNNFSSKEDYDIGNSEAFSQIILYDSNYKSLGTLVTWKNTTEEDEKSSYVSLENITYADIDNDGIMEIIVEVPEYEGGSISVYKYDEGKVEGELEYQVDTNP